MPDHSSESQRSLLPVPDQTFFGHVSYDASDPDSTFPPISDIRPPKGAPNVLVILLDDVGFGASSAFGGPCHTPAFEKLADQGLKYNRFHTTALCAPTRAALLSGRNHHSVGMGSITESATSAPGQSGVRMNSKATLATTLKLNGYSTAQFGKCHEVPTWQTSPIGPFDAWPTGGGGFEYFYGFIGGENNQFVPALYEGTNPVEPETSPEDGYHLTEDLADRAIDWIRTQKSLAPDRPFFAYFAPGATHAPHHVPLEWADKYKGRFADGWDALRAETFERQKQLGVIAPDAELTARPDEITAWADMDPALKTVLERQMEVYAGFLEHTDYHCGRIVEAIDALGISDDTMIITMIGDNGASAEGTMQGAYNEMANFNGMAALETPEFLASVIDTFGTVEAYNHYSVGWAHAMNTPFQWTKQVASHWGGTRNGTIVTWPSGIKDAGGVREQFTHVIDIAPTILEAAGIAQPVMVNGVTQSPIEGTSFNYTFDGADEPERHDLQYFEMFGNRGIYYKGWSAVTRHSTPWVIDQAPVSFDEDVWELYDASTDGTQARDLSAEHPEKLRELQRLWLMEAVKYNVLPLDDRRMERLNPTLAGRPVLAKGPTQTLLPGMKRLSEHAVLDTKNRSYSVTAAVDSGDKPMQGVIIAQGGGFGGWAFYALEGRLVFTYNLLGIKHFDIPSDSVIDPGAHQVRAEFTYDGGGLGKGGMLSLFCDGEAVGSGRIDATQPVLFSADETTDIGDDVGLPVSKSYVGDSKFNGKIEFVQIDVGDDDHSHLVDQDTLVQVAMARQ